MPQCIFIALQQAKLRGRNLGLRNCTLVQKTMPRRHHKKYVTMDTVGENGASLAITKKCGFDFFSLSSKKITSSLPTHYSIATVCLFNMSFKKIMELEKSLC